MVSTFGSNLLNEFRVQYAAPPPEFGRQRRLRHRPGDHHQRRRPISSAARVGHPGQGNAGFDFKQNIWQVIDNFTMVKGKHAVKFGFDWQNIYDERTAAPQFLYTFPTVAAYKAAKAGRQPVRLHERCSS